MSTQPPYNLSAINGLDRQRFVACLGAIFEHAPWVAERCFEHRPFHSLAILHASMMDAVKAATHDEQLKLVRGHPELAGREAVSGSMTDASTGEQGRLGLTQLSSQEFQRITALNLSYREEFGFPCIVALRLHDNRTSVLDEMERRLGGTKDAEFAAAIEQIGHVTWGRLCALLTNA